MTVSNDFQTVTVTSHYPATLLVDPTQDYQVLLRNVDPANTVYLGSNNAIEPGDINHTVPLPPNASYVAAGNIAVYGITASGLTAQIAKTPDAVNFILPPNLSQLGGAKVYVQTTAPTGTIPVNSIWFNTTLLALEFWNGATWNIQQFNAQELIQVSTILAAQIANATLTSAQLSAAAGILGSQIAANTISGGATGNLALNTITAANIFANTIGAGQLAAGIVYAGIVNGTTIEGSYFIAGTGGGTNWETATPSSAGFFMYYDTGVGNPQLFFSVTVSDGSDNYGNSWETGATFVGLAGNVLDNILAVDDTSGNKLAGIDQYGNVTGQIINAATDVQLASVSILSLIAPLPTGVVSWANNGIAAGTAWPSTAIGTTAIALMELDQILQAGRVYELIVSPVDATCSAAGIFFYINVHYTTDGSTPSNSSPNYSSYLLSSGSVLGGYGTAAAHHAGDTIVIVPATTANYRFLICANSTSGTFQLITPLQMTINDMGIATAANSTSQGTVLGSGSGGGSSKQTYTTNFFPAHTYSYYGNDATNGTPNTIRYTDTNARMYCGGESASGGAANGTQYHFMDYTSDPESIQSTLSGATINWIQLYWFCNHSWDNSGMYVTVGYNSNGHIGSPTSGRTDVLVNGGANDYFHVAEGAWGYCQLPNAVASAFASGAAKSIQLGPGTPLMDVDNYGYGGGLSGGCYLRVNYTKLKEH